MEQDDNPKVRALVKALQPICKELPGSEQYVMVHHPAFRVGKKPFAIAGLNRREVGGALSINLGRDAQGDLLDDERFMRTPYIGQHGWVTISHADLRGGELRTLVVESWKRVANKKQLEALQGEKQTPTKKKAAKKQPAKKQRR